MFNSSLFFKFSNVVSFVVDFSGGASFFSRFVFFFVVFVLNLYSGINIFFVIFFLYIGYVMLLLMFSYVLMYR